MTNGMPDSGERSSWRDRLATLSRSGLPFICRPVCSSSAGRYGSDERRGLLPESLRLAVETDDREQEFRTRTNILRECIRSADGEGVDHELVHLQRLTAELRQRDFVRIADQALAGRALWRGRLDEAERCIQAALGRREQAHEAAFQVFATQIGALRRFQGRLAEVERSTRRGRELFPNVVGYPIHLACYLAELGRDAEARAEFERHRPARLRSARAG